MPALSPPTGELRTFSPRTNNSAHTPAQLVESPVHVGTTDLDRHNPDGLRGGEPSRAEKELANRKITDASALGGQGNVNETYLAELDNAATGVFKPVAGENHSVRSDIPGDLGRREVAASRVDELFGFGLVPTTAMNEIESDLAQRRQLPAGPGSLQLFAENSSPGLDSDQYPVRQQQQIAVLDYVIGNTDRHDGNYLTGPNGELVAIDHGYSFPVGTQDPIRSDFIRDHVNRPLDPAVLAAVRAVDVGQLRAMLVDSGLSTPAVELAAARLEEIQQDGMITGRAWPGQLVDVVWRTIRKGVPRVRADANAGRALRQQHWHATLRRLVPLVGGGRGDTRDLRPRVVPPGDPLLRAGGGATPGTADVAPGRGPGLHAGAPATVSDELLHTAGREPDQRVAPPVVRLLRKLLAESVAYPGGRAFFAAGDPLLDTAHRVPPQDGTYTVDMHGGPDGVRVGRDQLTAAHLAALLMADPNWHGQPIRLLACRTGADPDGFAQQLADRLQVPVTAPTDYVGVADDGTVFVTSRDVDASGMPPISPPTGELRTFTPRADVLGTRTEVLRTPDVVGPSDLDHHNPWGLRGGGPAQGPNRPGPKGFYFPDEPEVTLGVHVDIGPDDPLPCGTPIHAGDERLWPDELANLVADRPEWTGGPIRLSVRNGQLDPEFGQRLAVLLGVPVLLAPEGVADGFAGCSSGTLEVYNEPAPATPPDARWHVFEPRNATTMEAP